MELDDILDKILEIQDGLFNGDINFHYDNSMCALKPGHPGEILDEILYSVFGIEGLDDNTDINKFIELKSLLESYRDEFQVNEINDLLEMIDSYIKERIV